MKKRFIVLGVLMFFLTACQYPPLKIILYKEIKSEYGQALQHGKIYDQKRSEKGIRIQDVKGFDPFQLGKQEIEVTFCKKKQTITKPITLTIEDTKKPCIKVKQESITIHQGEQPNYKKIILAIYDEVDGKLPFHPNAIQKSGYYIDDSHLDITKPGKQAVYIKAYDANKKQSVKKIVVQVKKKIVPHKNSLKPIKAKLPPQKQQGSNSHHTDLNKVCDEILASIMKPQMSQKEKAYAIYRWVSQKIAYRGITDPSTYEKSASKTLVQRRGNCIGYCFSTHALCQRAGIESIIIHSPSKGHYWNMVRIHQRWYHMDTTPGWGCERFLWTDAQMQQYHYKDLYYVWDKKQYPKAN